MCGLAARCVRLVGGCVRLVEGSVRIVREELMLVGGCLRLAARCVACKNKACRRVWKADSKVCETCRSVMHVAR